MKYGKLQTPLDFSTILGAEICVTGFFFFFYILFFISWRLIILQYCSGFCHTLT